MKNFLILIRYKVSLEVVERHTDEHRAYLKTQYELGRLLMSGPFVPRIAGVLWAQAGSREEIDLMVTGDPFHKYEVADWEIVEFKPVMFAESLRATLEGQNSMDKS